MDVASILIFFFVGLVVFLFITRRKHSKPVPPGPRGWELVRAFLSFLNGTLALQAEEWASLYGDVVFCPLPLDKLVFLNSSSVTKEFFMGKSLEKFTNDKIWSYVAEKLCLRKCIGFAPPSDFAWNQMRKLLRSNLKVHGEGMKTTNETMQMSLDHLVSTLDCYTGQDIEIVDFIADTIISEIGILLTGETKDRAHIQAMKRFNKCLLPVLDPSFSFALRICPVLDYIPGTYYTRARKAMEQSQKEISKYFFDDIRNTRVPGSPRGIVDHLLEYQSKEGGDWMTDDHVKGMIIDFVAAGVFPTVHFLNATVFHLLHHQDVIRKIQEEVDRVIGPGRRPTLSDRPECRYTETAILECLRMSPPFTLVDHLVTQDVELNGFCIPKGSVAFSVMGVCHRNSDLWTDPDSFKPERFLDQDGQLLPANHPKRLNLQPFGKGKRSCPGETWARARVFLYVTTLLQLFDILPPIGGKLLPMEKDSWIYGGIKRLKFHQCCLRRRQQ